MSLPVLRPRLRALPAVGGADGLVLRLDDPPVDAASRLPDRNVVLAYSVGKIYFTTISVQKKMPMYAIKSQVIRASSNSWKA